MSARSALPYSPLESLGSLPALTFSEELTFPILTAQSACGAKKNNSFELFRILLLSVPGCMTFSLRSALLMA